jgi:hypothetical protein
MAGFCELAIGLHAPNLATFRRKTPKVSGCTAEYSRFRETATRDRFRSALRGRCAVLFAVVSDLRGHKIGSSRSCNACPAPHWYVRHEQIDLGYLKPGERNIQPLSRQKVCQLTEFDRQHLAIPTGLLGNSIVSN